MVRYYFLIYITLMKNRLNYITLNQKMKNFGSSWGGFKWYLFVCIRLIKAGASIGIESTIHLNSWRLNGLNKKFENSKKIGLRVRGPHGFIIFFKATSTKKINRTSIRNCMIFIFKKKSSAVFLCYSRILAASWNNGEQTRGYVFHIGDLYDRWPCGMCRQSKSLPIQSNFENIILLICPFVLSSVAWVHPIVRD